MRRKVGFFFMLFGTVLLCGALSLFLLNRQEANNAETIVQQVLPQLQQQIPEVPQQEDINQKLIPPELVTPEQAEMTETIIDGLAYIGYLSIPSQGLDLPVLSDWNYEILRKSPCRYTGSTKTDDLVLMAHNYDRHFGRLSKLVVGDSVYFTDMDGILTTYQVVARDVLPPDAVEEMTSGEFDLTLFTCTYGGQSRITVYCDYTE